MPGELSNLDYLTSAFMFVLRGTLKDPRFSRAQWLARACNPRAFVGGEDQKFKAFLNFKANGRPLGLLETLL